jgi:branched-chain amino acid transport system substrate-binding protein
MNKKILLVVVAVVVAVLLGWYFLGNKKENEASETLKVGAVIALTGYGSDFGQSEKNAIDLLRQKYSSKNVEFFVEDSKSEVRDGINATKKLLEINKVDIIYNDLSTIVNATSQMIENRNKILLAPVYLNDLTQNNKLAIRNMPSAKQEIDTLISFLQQNNIVPERYAIFYSNDIFGETSKNVFTETVGKDKIVFSSAILDNSIKEIALKAMQTTPDVIYIGSILPNLGHLIKEMKILGFRGEFITTDAFSYPYINSVAGDYSKDVIYIDFDGKTDEYKKFALDYKNRFGTEVVATAVICYDGLSLLIEQLLNTKSTDFVNTDIDNNGIYGNIQLRNREVIYPIKALRW